MKVIKIGLCDEFIDDEQLEEIKIDYGAGLCREEWLRIRDRRLREIHMDFWRIPDFKVRSQNLRWLIY